MRLAILTFLPSNQSLATYDTISGYAKYLEKWGVEVHVFSPFSENQEHDSPIIQHNISEKILTNDLVKRVHDINRFIYDSKKLNWLLLNKYYLNFVVDNLTKRVIKSIKSTGLTFDIIEGVLDLPAMAAINASKMLGIPSVAHIHDIWYEECVDFNIINKQSLPYNSIKNMVGRILNDADLVIVPTRDMKIYYEKEFSIDNKIVYVPRGGSALYHPKENKNDVSRIIYSGSLQRHENVELYIQSIPFILEQEKEVEFYITGKGEHEPALKRLSDSIGVDVKFIWFDKKSDLHEFMSKCTLGIIPWSKKISRKFGFPLKLLEYLSVGLPVVATDIGGWTNLLSECEFGVTTNSTPHDFAGGIIHLLRNPDISYKYSLNGQLFLKKYYDIEKNSKLLFECYNELIK